MASELQDLRAALRREYGHPYTYRGVRAFDYTKHPFVGRACALLLRAERIETALREARDYISSVRVETLNSHMNPRTGKPVPADVVDFEDELLKQIEAALGGSTVSSGVAERVTAANPQRNEGGA